MTFVGNKSCRQDNSATRSYMQNRYLDMPKAKWVTQDPTGTNEGDPNAYIYALNRPTVVTDPSGLFPCWLCLGLGIVDPLLVLLCDLYCYGKRLTCPAGPPQSGNSNQPTKLWHCVSDCRCIGATPPCGQIYSGEGSGSTEDAACRNAKKDACDKCQPRPTCVPKHAKPCTCERK